MKGCGGCAEHPAGEFDLANHGAGVVGSVGAWPELVGGVRIEVAVSASTRAEGDVDVRTQALRA